MTNMTNQDKAAALRAYVGSRGGVEKVRILRTGEVHAFGSMPHATGSGWYLAGYAAELLVQMRAEREVQDCGRVGHRQGPGQPRLVPGQTTESVQVRLDPARRAKAEAIGGGKVAKGLRAALDAYQAVTLQKEENTKTS